MYCPARFLRSFRPDLLAQSRGHEKLCRLRFVDKPKTPELVHRSVLDLRWQKSKHLGLHSNARHIL